LTVGGRIRVNVVTGTNQQFFGARLLNAAGHECKTNFTHSDVDVEGASSWTSSPGNLRRGANDTFPNLEPGDYRLQVLREGKTRSSCRPVVAGRTSEIPSTSTRPEALRPSDGRRLRLFPRFASVRSRSGSTEPSNSSRYACMHASRRGS
jgi:hypothetical protein